MKTLRAFWAVAVLLLAGQQARAWWDTQVRAQTPVPLVKAVNAADCQGAQDVRSDAQADGGRGGKAVYLKPGQGLTFTADLKPGVYAVWGIARALSEEYVELPAAEQEQEFDLPGGKVKMSTPRKPVYVRLTVQGPGGGEESWHMPVAYRTDYAVVTSMYFPLHVDGPCRITLGLDERSALGLLFNRLELRDTLGNCPRVAAKTRRMLTSDAELAELRKAPAPKRGLAADRSDEDRRKRNDELWDSLPPLNLMVADPLFKRWPTIIGQAGKNGVQSHAQMYQQTGNNEAGWDAAVLLCAIADKYPGLDHYFSEVGVYSNFASNYPLTWGSRMGKTQYSGHASSRLEELAAAYDRIFDFVQDRQALADYVGTRIPWVRTPQDVIKLIDTNLLQHGMDCLNRRVMRGDRASAMIPLVQGVNPVSHKMLLDGLFSKVHYDMADAGGLDDQVFTAFSRGGVHYIGATGYVGGALTDIAGMLAKYVAAGGDPRFNMDNPKLYPNMPEAEPTKQKLHAAGGFPIIVGDSMDLRRGREKEAPPAYPSRYVEGFGQIVLEDGQDQANPLVKRAVGIHTGIGRGHAHQDTLNFEMFAHGCRLAPDLGGRHEGNNRSSPNMRINRMHNLVEVDERNFVNTSPGSTTSATGWPTALAPMPGSQYTAAVARATSHPEVSLYQRSMAMVDGSVSADAADVYLFDVFRVAGGSVHTYCFHGAPTADENVLDINCDLTPAASEIALAYLGSRPQASRQEGRSADPLQATWPLDDKMRTRYQNAAAVPDKPVGITLRLFGHGGEHVMVGSAESKVYPVAMPYLHVQKRGDAAGLQSVYPAVYEAWNGKPFITGSRELNVTPVAADARRGVALEVDISARRDTLFSSLKPDVVHEIEGGLKVAGEFAHVSRDDRGIRLLHLVGGTQMAGEGFAVACARPGYAAVIQSVDYAAMSMTLASDLPTKLLDGQVALLGNPDHWAGFELAHAGGRSATVVRTPRYYQSSIQLVDAQNRLVATELEPLVYGADTLHANGTTVANEAHDRFWRVKLQPRERWMSLAWPGTDLSYPREIRMEDLPDADGDGRRTLRLVAGAKDAARTEGMKVGATLVELEVTRVDPANHLFYFRMPYNPDYQEGGWQFANRELVNEDGSRKWLAGYPGTTFTWELLGDAPVDDAVFTDADGDGKRKLYAYHFGPGDELRVPAFVYVRRIAASQYEVRANIPCSLTLPGVGKVDLAEQDLQAGSAHMTP